MRNLIIIGNGFDKAHNLKTTYNEFVKKLIDNCIQNRNKFPEIFAENPPKFPSGISDYDTLKKSLQRGTPLNIPKPKNLFIWSLLRSLATYDWCDIEFEYFNELMKYIDDATSKNRLYKTHKELNDDFEVIKDYLSKYLIEEGKNAEKIDSYEQFFKIFATSSDTLILNFNYTKTLEILYGDVIKCPVINIHGQLENETNPMIFGYAATHEESRKLLNQNDDEYLRNIKKQLYKFTKNKNILNDFLGSNERNYDDYSKIDVFIFGHSCGLSDNLILKEIFNHKAIYSIKIFYYEDRNKYFEVQVGIDRIMNDDVNFEKLVPFPDSHRMPQWNDDKIQIQNFIKYIEDVNANYPIEHSFVGVFQ